MGHINAGDADDMKHAREGRPDSCPILTVVNGNREFKR